MRCRLALVKLVSLAALLLLVGLAGGCAQGADQQDSAPPPSTPAPVSEQRSQSLSREGSPGEVVLELWDYMELGALPPAVRFYDETVQESLGLDYLAGALQGQAGQARRLDARIAEVQTTGPFAVVTMVASGPGTVPRTFSFTLRRSDGRWTIVYDTMLENAVPAYVRERNGEEADARPNPDTVREAQRKLSVFRRNAARTRESPSS